jgi:hypothetical protein
MAKKKESTRVAAIRPKIRTFKLAEQGGLSPAEAKKALLRAVREIPAASLRNFRGGQILVLM